MRTYPKHNAANRAIQIPYDMHGREDYLIKELSVYQGKTFFCKSIGVPVLVTMDSVTETAYNASTSRKSSKIALYLPYIIRNAKPIALHLPTEARTQVKKFHFVEIGVFRCNVPKVGIAQIVIGYRRNGKTIEYAVTDYQVKKTTSG
ncbi:MAG: hypothetical protein K6A94_12125 [Bacteroidales bacterium]|nr:hypothetical protein [Bacteroidales bacterium]